MADLFPNAKLHFETAIGTPAVGWKLYTYAAGTLTPAATYQDSGAVTPNTNPIIMDARGECTAYGNVNYKFILKDSLDNTIWTQDNVNPSAASALQTLLATSAGAGMVGFQQTGSSVLRTVAAKLGDFMSVSDFGFIGDGSVADHAKLAAAIVAARGRTLLFPKGNYTINSNNGTLTVEEVDLVGENVRDGATGTIDQGSMLWITGTTNTPFKVRRGTSFSGLGFYYPNQVDSAAPTAYPATLTFDFTNGAVQFVEVQNCVAYNCYEFINIDDAAGAVGHVEILENYICALNRGIYLRYNSEHLRIEGNNFTFGFWLAATEGGARAYMRANATAIQIEQSDGVEIVDNLIFGQLNGVKMGGTSLCQLMKIVDNKFDQVRYGVIATGTGNFDGIVGSNTFNCLNPIDTTLQARAITVVASGAAIESITINDNNFDTATEDAVLISGNAPSREVVLVGNNARGWAAYKAAGVYGAFNISGALTNFQAVGNQFYGAINANHSYGITGAPNTADIFGNKFVTCARPISIVTNTYSAAGNSSYSTVDTFADNVTSTVTYSGANRWDKPTVNRPTFHANKNASQTFNSGVATDVTWGAESYDQLSNFASNSFTAPFTGTYSFSYSLLHDNSGTAGDRWSILLLVNGSAVRTISYKMIADYNSVGMAIPIKLTAADVVKLQVQRVGGAGNFVTLNDATANYFAGAFLE